MLTMFSSPQVLLRMPVPRATLPQSTPIPGSRRALLATLLSHTLATRAISRHFAARITTNGQAALFKESHACALHSHIPSVIAPYRSFSLPSCILGQIEYECGSIDSQSGFRCAVIAILLTRVDVEYGLCSGSLYSLHPSTAVAF